MLGGHEAVDLRPRPVRCEQRGSAEMGVAVIAGTTFAHQAIADYVLLVVPADLPAETLVGTLVVVK